MPRVKHSALPAQYEQTAWLRLELADPGSDARLTPGPSLFSASMNSTPAASRARRMAWSLAPRELGLALSEFGPADGGDLPRRRCPEHFKYARIRH